MKTNQNIKGYLYRHKANILLILAIVAFSLFFVTSTSRPVFADPQFSCSPTHIDKCSADTCVPPTGNWDFNSNQCNFGTNGGDNLLQPSSKCQMITFFGLEPWYEYLPYGMNPVTGQCGVGNQYQSDPGRVLGKQSFLLLIVLAIVDDLLRLAGMIAVAFVIIGGFNMIKAQGEPEKAAGARKTIVFALVGLVISLLAVLIVSFIGNTMGK